MWLVKQAASKVKQLSQQVLREKSEAELLAEDVVSNRHEVMPVRKMAELAALSFDMDSFDQIVQYIAGKLADIKFERKSLKKRLNILVLVVYLLKHGAGGFIDELRALSPELRRYEGLRNFVAEEDPEMRGTIQELRDRAAYLLTLLGDKALLLREKEVARLVREKLFLQGGDYSRQQQPQQQQEETSSGPADRVEEFLEHYVWRYTQKLDRKLDEITDILIAKIDEYLDGEMPEGFEIEEAEGMSGKPAFTKSEFELGGVSVKQEACFVQSKLAINEDRLDQIEQNLLELEEPVKEAPADLLVFEEDPQIGKENQLQQSNKLPQSVIVVGKVMDDDEIEAFRSELQAGSPPP